METFVLNKFLKICSKCGEPLYISNTTFMGIQEWPNHASLALYNCKACNTTISVKVEDEMPELPLTGLFL